MLNLHTATLTPASTNQMRHSVKQIAYITAQRKKHDIREI